MRGIKTTAMALLGGLLASSTAHAALTITTTTSASDLVNSIVGAGITTSNETFTTDTGTVGAAIFGGGNSIGGGGLGFDTGILLTTGSANLAPGPNDTGSAGGAGTFSQLSFDFTSNSGNVFFNYVFATEEFPEWVGTAYNDLFQLRLDGVNIALFPSGDAVTVNNIPTNSASFRGNTAFDLQYDGMTVVLTASAAGLGSSTHHFDFLIQDVGDEDYDSGVFVQGGTFSSEPPSTNVPEPATLALLGMGLLGLGVIRRRNN